MEKDGARKPELMRHVYIGNPARGWGHSYRDSGSPQGHTRFVGS